MPAGIPSTYSAEETAQLLGISRTSTLKLAREAKIAAAQSESGEWRFQPGGVIERLRQQEKQASVARNAAAQRLAAALEYSEQRDKFRNAQQAVGKLTQ